MLTKTTITLFKYEELKACFYIASCKNHAFSSSSFSIEKTFT